MVQKKKTNTKSRTIARPALRHRSFSKKQRASSVPFRHARSILLPIGYTCLVLLVFQFISVHIVRAFFENPMTNNSVRISATTQGKTSQTKTQTAPKGLPVRLIISSIHVNAAIRAVGLTSDGSMGIPKLPRDTAWYMLGPKPGEKGSAVVDGHINWWYGATGVFAHLNDIKKGDKIIVQNDRGENIEFVVRELRSFGEKDNPSEVFYSYDGKAHLNLVTCSGVWDKIAKVYTKRLVVFTDKVEK